MQKENKMQEVEEMAKRLESYMNELAWSQMELSRKAQISPVTAYRAVHDLPITKASALKIVKAISEEIGEKLTVSDFAGLKVEAVTMKKRDTRRKKAQEEK